ncbi:MAG: thioredoxin family protein [Cellulophaga sp.]
MESNIVEKTTEEIVQESLLNSMSYYDYRIMVHTLAENEKSTGSEQSEELANYSILNNRRMKRLDKTLKPTEDTVAAVLKVDKKITWLVLTESWCGDAAQTLPVMHKIAELNNKINLKVVLRDENVELMNRFLTNGGMAIPKLIAIDSVSGSIMGEWGSRPSEATEMVEAYKEKHGKLTPEFKEELQVWYNKDKGQNTFADLLNLLSLK